MASVMVNERTETNKHTHTKPELTQVSMLYSQIEYRVQINLLLSYMNNFIFTTCLFPHPCGQKRNPSKAYYEFVKFTAG